MDRRQAGRAGRLQERDRRARVAAYDLRGHLLAVEERDGDLADLLDEARGGDDVAIGRQHHSRSLAQVGLGRGIVLLLVARRLRRRGASVFSAAMETTLACTRSTSSGSSSAAKARRAQHCGEAEDGVKRWRSLGASWRLRYRPQPCCGECDLQPCAAAMRSKSPPSTASKRPLRQPAIMSRTSGEGSPR